MEGKIIKEAQGEGVREPHDGDVKLAVEWSRIGEAYKRERLEGYIWADGICGKKELEKYKELVGKNYIGAE